VRCPPDTTSSPTTRVRPTGNETNPYAYTGNDPVDHTDPWGSSFLDCLGSETVAVGGVLAFGGPCRPRTGSRR
jgi:hypothetical protein